MIDRKKRSALPPCRDVGATQITNDSNARHPREGCAIADLPCPMPIRPMCNSMAMKADNADVSRSDFRLGQQRPNRIGVRPEERSVGKGWVSTGEARWWPDH